MMHDGVKVSTRTFNSVIHTCARAKNLDAAESTVALMQSCGVAPDIVTYNTLLDACALSVHVSRSEWWFRQMISKGVKPNAITYSTMCKALSRIGGVQQIEELMERCEKVDGLPLNEQFYASLIIACGAKKPREEARALQAIEEMRSRGLPLANMRRALRAIRLDRRQERELLTQDAAQHKTSAGAAGPKSPCYHVPRSWVEGKHNSINSKDSSIYFQENVETQESLELYEDDFDSQEEEACFDAYEDLGFPIVAGASMSHQLQGLARVSGAQGCMPGRFDSKELSTSASFPDHLFDVMQDIEEESGYAAAAAAAGSSGGERSATVLLDFIKAQGDNLIRVQL
jgi:pentatricopeptide repeat protein